jgi:hypothetical protein
MRKLLILFAAFTLAPLACHAALVIDTGPSKPALPVTQNGLVVTAEPVTPTAQSSPASAASAIAIAQAEPTWVTSPEAGNFRTQIAEWAKRAGQDFLWDVSKDVPINGHDSYTGTYKDAVRRLLRSTELTSYKLKPCFYVNNYTRVVMNTFKCKPDANQ